MNFRIALACAWIFASSSAFSAGMIVGGYSQMPTSAPETLAFAKSAIAMKNALPESKKVRLVAIKSAESQVVAGTNFRLCLLVQDKMQAFRVQAAVYRDLGGKFLLTEWSPNGC